MPGGYALAMNRDERRTRAPALPPALVHPSGIPALIPVDGEAGGSWISVNALGHTLALLNRYHESPVDILDAFVSRGLLLIGLAGLPDPEAVEEELRRMPLARYRPFTLSSVIPDRAPRLFEWDGVSLAIQDIATPGLVRASSGHDQAGAERIRGALFSEARVATGLSAEVLLALHRSHIPESGPLSICMHREEAATVSCSLITVSEGELSFRYIDGPPGETGSGTVQTIARI